MTGRWMRSPWGRARESEATATEPSDGTPRTGVFSFATPNLGDDMQSFAVMAHLDRVSAFLDRDRLAEAKSAAPTFCVFNSWFLLGDDRRVPAESVRPLFHGFCAGRGWVRKERDWLAYMKRHEPIGCRDLVTAEDLASKGIETYWSGCLTLFLGRFFPPVPEAERKEIVFIDVPPEAEEALIPREIRDAALRLSNFVAPSMIDDPFRRFAATARLVDILRRAKLVVTRRLHVALPCVGFGTPVVAIPVPGISKARRRFSGFDQFVPTIYSDDLAKEVRIDWSAVPPSRIPDELDARRQAFVAELETLGLAAASGPAIAGGESVTIRNPDRDPKPGRAAFAFGGRRFEHAVRRWSDRAIEMDVASFPNLEKFEIFVEIAPHGGTEWRRLGRLADLREP